MPNTSFESREPGSGPGGQLAHPGHIEQSERLERRLFQVTDKVWSMVGNGLSNQSFVEGPEGLICIDTGESIEEMKSALAEVRRFTGAPVVACIYTHFHYVNGTAALTEESGEAGFEIYGHRRIAANLARYGGEIGPRIARGVVYQFGIAMPPGGVDGCVNVGLGNFFRNPEHSPFTSGHLPVTREIDEMLDATVAGLRVQFQHAPSDADDSITIWFPELGVCINNLVWPALFNVFAIRGEEYRDPRILLTGLDHLLSLAPEHLLCTHGPPVSGKDMIREVIVDYRDSIQFLWDQTVRGANKGLGLDELTGFVSLPERFDRTYFTRQYYGLVEHHVRQIYTGLFGWFDEDPANLFPLPPVERAEKLIEGFGGSEKVRHRLDDAIAHEDYRWAVELASWLVRTRAEDKDRVRLAGVLRTIGQRTISANIRNWCITSALELEGKVDLVRLRQHRFRFDDVLARPSTYVHVLKVLLVPERTSNMDEEVRWEFDDGAITGLRIRRGVAIPTSGEDAAHVIAISRRDWAEVLSGGLAFGAAWNTGKVAVRGDEARVRAFFFSFDHPSFG